MKAPNTLARVKRSFKMEIIKKSIKHKDIFQYKNSQGTFWGFRLKYYDLYNKRREKRGSKYKTEREAFEALIEFLDNINKKQFNKVDRSKITVSEWYEIYLDIMKPNDKGEGAWSLGSYISRLGTYEKHIKPLIGDIKLVDLDLITYEKLYIGYLKNHHAPSTIKSYHQAMNTAINAAVRRRYLDENLIQYATLPKEQDIDEGDFISSKTLNDILQYILEYEPINNRTLIFLLAHTGMRLNEARGLMWKNIKIKEGQIQVYHQMNDYKKGPLIIPTKGRNKRIIKVSNELISLLKLYRNWCIEQSFKNKRQFSDDDLVFISKRSYRPMSRNTSYFRLKKACQYLGYEEISPHTLRHTYASILLMHGQSYKKVSKILGNTEQVLINTYSHVIPDINDNEVDIMSSVVNIGAVTGAD